MVRHRLVLCLALILSVWAGCASLDPVAASRLRILESALHGVDQRFRSAAIRLVDKGADSAFICQILHYPSTTFLEKMLKINVSGFLKPADYSHNFNAASVKAAREFVQQNLQSLQRTQDSTGVSKEAIASILWVETKYGKITGDYNVISVYASLAAADEVTNIEENQQSYRPRVQDRDSLRLLDSMVEARARRKAQWAVDQLMALREMRDRLGKPINELRGSWAGAFGWSQFIPSSYVSWAVDGDGDGKIDLYNKEDAIASVGNYLKVNGWGPNRSQQEAAVFHYNNSRDYVNCVLTLAQKIADTTP